MTSDDTESGSTADAAPAPGGRPELPLDAVFELLADRRRRFALYALSDATDGVATYRSLVEEVATLEASLGDGGLSGDLYLDVAEDVHYWQLEVLADVGVVETDERSGTIRYQGTPRLEAWIGRARRDELDRRGSPK